MADAEGHARGLRLHAQVLEEPVQEGIGHAVEHHEARVDGKGARRDRLLDRHRVRMPAHVRVLLEDRDVKVALQEMGASQTGDACPHDGEAAHKFTGDSRLPMHVGLSKSMWVARTPNIRSRRRPGCMKHPRGAGHACAETERLSKALTNVGARRDTGLFASL